MLGASKITAQSACSGEIYLRPKLASRPPDGFGRFAEERQGCGGLALGVLTVTEDDKRRSGAQCATGAVKSEFTADPIEE